MLTLGGFGFLLACVFGTYVVEGGSIGALLESLPFEIITIGGAAIGTFVMPNSMHEVKHTLHGLGKALKGAAFKKTDYVDLLSLLYLLVRLASTKGTMAVEPHIEKPEESAAFSGFRRFSATALLCLQSATICGWWA